MFNAALAQAGAGEILDALRELRAGVVSADAWRSVAIIALSLGACALYYFGQIKKEICLALVLVISFFDLWSVDKRYLNVVGG